ncbi:MAG TPA: hypothetical protein VLC48_04185 [Gemmatimonadota bacterium]|nr:hypothetical protein [Gemmatimonadota bacterium]
MDRASRRQVTGQPPFASNCSVELLIDHMRATPTRPSQVSELLIPKQLDDLIMKCLAVATCPGFCYSFVPMKQPEDVGRDDKLAGFNQ